MIKKILAIAVCFTLVFTVVPTQSEAALSFGLNDDFLEDYTSLYLTGKNQDYSEVNFTFYGIDSIRDIDSVISSDNSVVSPGSVEKYSTEAIYFADGDFEEEPAWENDTYYCYCDIHKPGKASVTINSDGEQIKKTIEVFKYANPVATFKFAGSKNFKKHFNASAYYGEPLDPGKTKDVKNAKLVVKAAKNWVITMITYESDSYESNFDGCAQLISNENKIICEYYEPVSSAKVSLGTVRGEDTHHVEVTFLNTKTDTTLTVSYIRYESTDWTE